MQRLSLLLFILILVLMYQLLGLEQYVSFEPPNGRSDKGYSHSYYVLNLYRAYISEFDGNNMNKVPIDLISYEKNRANLNKISEYHSRAIRLRSALLREMRINTNYKANQKMKECIREVDSRIIKLNHSRKNIQTYGVY